MKLSAGRYLVFPALIMIATVVADTGRANDAQPAIPQHQEKIKVLRDQRRDHAQKIFVAAYEKHGKKSPAWEESAQRCVQTAARVWGGGYASVPLEKLNCGQAATEAVKQGCTDPLIVGLALVCDPLGFDRKVTFDVQLFNAWNAISTSPYGGVPKAIILGGVVEFVKNVKVFKKEERDAFVRLTGKGFCHLMKDDWQINRDVAERLLDVTLTMSAKYGDSVEETWKVLDRSCAEFPEDGWIRQVIKGYYHSVEAWNKRGDGLAPTVSPEAADGFRTELQLAKKCFEASWAKHSKHMIYGEAMMDVAKGLGLEREEMELWFRRAMDTNGDDIAVCRGKADYLHPKWGGTNEALLEFGRQCAATKNYFAGIPIILFETNLEVARRTSMTRFQKKEVFAEIEAMFQAQLADQPLAIKQRWQYATMAHTAQKYDLARKLFQELGESPPHYLMDGKPKYDQLKKVLDEKAPVKD